MGMVWHGKVHRRRIRYESTERFEAAWSIGYQRCGSDDVRIRNQLAASLTYRNYPRGFQG